MEENEEDFSRKQSENKKRFLPIEKKRPQSSNNVASYVKNNQISNFREIENERGTITNLKTRHLNPNTTKEDRFLYTLNIFKNNIKIYTILGSY